MSIDRSKFKDKTRASDLKTQDSIVENVIDKKNRGEYASYHKIENGDNVFRMYPPHPTDDEDESNSFIETVQKWWLPADVEDRDDDGNVKTDSKGKPIIKRVRKTIFDARIHSSVGKDICNEYVEFLSKILKGDGLSQADIDEKMKPIYGHYSKNPSERVQGITGKPEWVAYADKIVNGNSTFGRLSIGKAVKYRVNDIIAREEANEPIGTEATNPFTDIENGKALIITYNKDATKAQDYYKTEVDTSSEKVNLNGRMVLVQKTYSLTDDQLEAFMKYPSLASQYKNSYTKRDFQLALQGLKILDDEEDFGVFQYDEFLEICEQLQDLYPEHKEEPVEAETDSDEDDIEDDEETSDDSSDMFSDMTRAELKVWNKENKTGIIVRQSMSDNELRDLLRTWVSEQDLEEEGEELDEDSQAQFSDQTEKPHSNLPKPPAGIFDESVETEESEDKEGKAKSVKDRLAKLKNKK